ncbi:MAG: hypothetical protein SF052_11105 [Bacteroidia bacterium]|nr:hypothetical protein [Bacteroidia bacterium]
MEEALRRIEVIYHNKLSALHRKPLYLRANQLTVLPEGFSELKGLMKLDMAENIFSEPPVNQADFPNLSM